MNARLSSLPMPNHGRGGRRSKTATALNTSTRFSRCRHPRGQRRAIRSLAVVRSAGPVRSSGRMRCPGAIPYCCVCERQIRQFQPSGCALPLDVVGRHSWRSRNAFPTLSQRERERDRLRSPSLSSASRSGTSRAPRGRTARARPGREFRTGGSARRWSSASHRQARPTPASPACQAWRTPRR